MNPIPPELVINVFTVMLRAKQLRHFLGKGRKKRADVLDFTQTCFICGAVVMVISYGNGKGGS